MKITVDIGLSPHDPQAFRLLRQVKAGGDVVSALQGILTLLKDPTRGGSLNISALSS